MWTYLIPNFAWRVWLQGKHNIYNHKPTEIDWKVGQMCSHLFHIRQLYFSGSEKDDTWANSTAIVWLSSKNLNLLAECWKELMLLLLSNYAWYRSHEDQPLQQNFHIHFWQGEICTWEGVQTWPRPPFHSTVVGDIQLNTQLTWPSPLWTSGPQPQQWCQKAQ